MKLTDSFKMLIFLGFSFAVCGTSQATTIVIEESFEGGIPPANMTAYTNGGLVQSVLSNDCSGQVGLIVLRNQECPPNPQVPFSPWILDFYNGGGSYVTFSFVFPSGVIITSADLAFKVVTYGSDSGQLFKYSSSDAVNWMPVGDDTALNGQTYHISLISGSNATYAKLQVGSSNGLYDGVWLDMTATISYVPEPSSIALFVLGLAGFGAARRKPQPA